MLKLLLVILYAIQFMAGAALFSFLGVVAWRLPRGLPIAKGRSFCPACHAQLTARDLVPVFSWLALRGKCRHCGARISPLYLLLELLGGGAALLCSIVYGISLGGLAEGVLGFRWQGLLVLVLLGILTTIALIDAETQTIPNRLSLAVALCGVAAIWLMPDIGWQSRLIGAVCVSVPMLVLCLVIPGAFGGGDIKLMAGAGLFLGWPLTLFAAFCAILTGGFYGIWLLASKKADKKAHFAFGPFLCAGIAFSLFCGNACLGWYLQFF